ncbi:MAG TPA: F0F1 ATP synthase subunit epsilon [Acidimicrobiia bacterium]|nr:F0F1 ATP synthase subunit epsilon [Acidimicrobiia bacterium]
MPLEVQLVSPEQVLYRGEARMVLARTMGGGDIAFLPGHAPFLGALETWPVTVVLEGNQEYKFAVHGGFVEVANDRVIVLSDVAELPESIDVDRARASLAAAEGALRANPDDADATAAAARARVRLDVAGATTPA